MFFPVGFCSDQNTSLAHLSEHCLLEMIRRDLFEDIHSKPFFMLFNAMTTSYYTCIWFSSPISIYDNLRDMFVNSIEKITHRLQQLDNTIVNHEKIKIINELRYLKRQNCIDGKSGSNTIYDKQGVLGISIEEIHGFMNKYIIQGGVLLEYGGLDRFQNTTCELENQYFEISLIDKQNLLINNVSDLTLINLWRLINYIAQQEEISTHFRQLTNKSMYISFDIPIKNAIQLLLNIDDNRLQYYIEKYYENERNECNDSLEFLKRMYKLFRQTGFICNKKEWYKSIYQLPNLYRKTLIYVRDCYDKFEKISVSQG